MRSLWRGFSKNWQIVIGLGWLVLIAGVPITSWPWISDQITNHKSEDLQKWGWYLLGAGIAPLTLLLTHNRTQSLRMQTDALRAQTDTDIFTKSIELLGDEKAAVRQGGIYSLGKIAKDDTRLHSTIMKIMTSYIREKSYENFHKQLEQDKSPDNEKRLIKKLRNESSPSDIDAAIDVIRERKVENIKQDDKKSFQFDLSSSRIFSADLSFIELRSTNMSDSMVQKCCFDQSILSDSSFVSSDLQESTFVKAILKNCEFKDTNFCDCDFKDCDLSGSKFEKCDLTDAKNLTQEQINSATVDQDTKLPEGRSYLKESVAPGPHNKP
ncbi:pentapeptide repeat-containing protein [Candidatus Synechococcus spongiarum]|uniref:pentapeptide repeat-containing protein n=1 Tax=Candidatus Synechococcus spongiarum TaxID=431041 RepID=UPI0009B8E6E0|nr:pentapeptide repeat-containing protein [Candidatus Synechococcus spongiarum]